MVHTRKKRVRRPTYTRRRPRERKSATATDDGWIRVTIRGAPYERGVSHGKQILAADPTIFTRMFSTYDFLFRQGYGRDIEFFYGLCDDFYKGIIKRRSPKIFREMEGIAAGAGLRVCQVILINVYMSLPYFYAHMLRYIDTPKYRGKYTDVIRDEHAIAAGVRSLWPWARGGRKTAGLYAGIHPLAISWTPSFVTSSLGLSRRRGMGVRW
jgi:hypothetical protein